MLDPRFKTFYLVSSFISLEQGKAIVEEYDKKNYISYAYEMLLSFASIG